MSMIITENLSRHYGRRTGIDSLNLAIDEGEIFGFLGPNGAGKSTTIRLLMGFLPPSRGRAAMMEKDCWQQSREIKQDVGYLPGDVRLYSWLTGQIAVDIASKMRGRDLRAHAADLSDRFRLEMDLKVRKMSRGTRQKLGLLLALVHQPRLLILDEPTSGLDPLMQQALAQCLREFASRGHTVFFSSHSLSEVESLCDRIAIVRRGKLVADESLTTLRARAPRIVTLRYAEDSTPASAELPPFLHLLASEGRHWRCTLSGPTPPFIAWAAQQPLDDMTVSPPDLDHLFRQYYENSDEMN